MNRITALVALDPLPPFDDLEQMAEGMNALQGNGRIVTDSFRFDRPIGTLIEAYVRDGKLYVEIETKINLETNESVRGGYSMINTTPAEGSKIVGVSLFPGRDAQPFGVSLNVPGLKL